MEYNIKLTEEFLEEIDEICDYLCTKLKIPEFSKRLIEKIMYNILLLEKFPKLFTEIDKFDRVRRRYRKIVIENYIILYTIDEKEMIIYISHIYYNSRNYMKEFI